MSFLGRCFTEHPALRCVIKIQSKKDQLNVLISSRLVPFHFVARDNVTLKVLPTSGVLETETLPL